MPPANPRRRPKAEPGAITAAVTEAVDHPAPNSLLASARLLNARKGAIAKPTEWSEEAWGYYDTTPELRFACSWYGNALSRCRLVLAKRGGPGEDPTPLDANDPRLALLDDLGTADAQGELLSSFAPHLIVPGIGYMVGMDEARGPDQDPVRTWQVLSSSEIRVKGDTFQVENEDGAWVDLPADSMVCKVWRRHARKNKPDSPVRALLTVLRELSLLTAHVEAAATSRLAGAGILLISNEVQFPVSEANKDAEDPFMAELTDAMLTPIADRSAASAVVPYPVRVPPDSVDKIKHLTFATPFDEQAITLREEARQRFAAGMDMPAEVLLGLGDSNHWTAWQIEESAIKLHIVPMLETIVAGLTVGWLHPTGLAEASTNGWTPESIEELVVWFTVDGLTVRPDRSQDAKDLYGMDAINLDALLRECGFGEGDKVTPEDTKRKLLIAVVQAAPTLFPIIAPLLDIQVTIPAGVEALDPGTGADPMAPATVPADAPADGVPGTQDVTPEESLAASASGELIAACDGLVARALEVAGNRLGNLARSGGVDLAAFPPDEAHLHVEPTCLADLDRLLAGAWRRVPLIAERHGVDPEGLTDALSTYTRALLVTATPHTADRLSDALGTGEPAAA